MVAHQAPPSLGSSRQEHWSGLPFPSPVHESEKWKWSHSVLSDSERPHGLQPTRLLCPWNFPGKSTRVGCHGLLCYYASTTLYFDYRSFRISLEIRCESSNAVLFFKIVLAIWGSLQLHMILRVGFSVTAKNCSWNFVGILIEITGRCRSLWIVCKC